MESFIFGFFANEFVISIAAACSSPGQSALRKRLAWKAMQHCASYDSVIAEWMWQDGGVGQGQFPPEMSRPMKLMNTLRYGARRLPS